MPTRSRRRVILSSTMVLAAVLIVFTAARCGNGGSGSPAEETPPVTDTTDTTAPGGIPQVSLVRIAGGFAAPTHITHAGDGSNRLFVVEQRGSIKIIKNGAVLQSSFLDISQRVRSGGERGLFVIVFPKGYPAQKNYFYVNYTGNQGDGDTFISRFRTTADPDIADPGSEQQLLTVDQPFANHNGGQMAFGPDGYLYIGMGDGGSAGDPANNAQNPGVLLGKMLRIDVESQQSGYSIPAGNPFAGRAGHRAEIWASGLRNPWRFSFDRQTGDLFIADVGQNAFEEVNVQPASSRGGENYGWDIMEGRHCYNSDSCNQTGLTLPVLDYPLEQGNCAATGGFVYRGAESPSLQGVYVYGDFCSGRIWGLKKSGQAWENKLLLDTNHAISTFGEDEAGNIYLADHRGGDIYKIVVP